ncbi:hypothetical protein SPRG_07460 [Saprolegnia parasitica CBS 223.65]|uniref:Uncharacterized protein n=1 Tax=Saprolegnia parasitica (strain CBS 223.65) TaxID=695850 RepID=A0A067CKZ8_SAPPC|nr:hypothetical protein SPRG_07460 [Saprolegnia parasitica CBS 223.65]KDO27211.1 hypothetical protein SPRG_07460 [Saprolegnia parasitica CBS 223.65]|eukprot:XP_012201989.1 hypothetical protein SPRG_07460 [Saprolegnia parasitica CBS 223.65]
MLHDPTHSEVCKISMRSAKKLEDHVNHSPLHKAAMQESELAFQLELNGGRDDRPSSPCRQRLIYDGNKLFWRINETLELHMYEAINVRTITVLAQKDHSREKIKPLVLDLTLLHKCIASPSTTAENKQQPDEDMSSAAKREAMIKYILARLQAIKDSGDAITLYIQTQNGDLCDPTTTADAGRTYTIEPDSLVPRRRHTYDEAKVVQKDLDHHTAALKSSRRAAEKHSDSIRLALDAFIDLGTSVKTRPHDNGISWLGAYSRVRQRNTVEVFKERMKHGHDGPGSPSSKATDHSEYKF